MIFSAFLVIYDSRYHPTIDNCEHIFIGSNRFFFFDTLLTKLGRSFPF